MSDVLIGANRPVCFLHIPKTGGTSVKDALARLYPADRVFSDQGRLSVDFLRRMENRIGDRTFIAGHAGPGVVTYLQARADFITMLRRPDEQAVSNYLYVLAHADDPTHAVAANQSFSDYLRANIPKIYYQSEALCVALAEDDASVATFGDGAVRALRRFLAGLPFVGVIERAEACGEVLSRLMRLERPLELPCLNSAAYRGVSTKTVRRLLAEYHALRDDAALSPLFAQEAAIYEEANAILDRLSQVPQARARPSRPPVRPGLIAASRFSTARGQLEGDQLLCRLTADPAHLVYGPYDRLPPGPHTAEFHLAVRDAGAPQAGQIQIEVLSNRRACLRKRWLNSRALGPGQARTLAFINPDARNVLEFRVRARGFRSGTLVFEGVTIRPAAPREGWLSMARRVLG